jgi:hypothetical protein
VFGDVVPAGGGCSGARPESRTLALDDDPLPRPIVAVVPVELSPQPVAQLSAALVAAGAAVRAGSVKTLCNGCGSFDATLGKLAVERTLDVVVALLKLDAVVGIGVISKGGAATEVPMLVHPPSTGVTLGAAARVVVAGMVLLGLAGQLGADEPGPAVFAQGDETPPRGELLGAPLPVDEVNGLDVAWPLAVLKPPLGAGGWP